MPNRTLYQTTSPYTVGQLIDRRVANWIGERSLRLQEQRGYRMAVFANDLIGIDINQFGIYERQDLSLLFDFLAPLRSEFQAGMALDIGANIGNHSRVFAQRFAAVHAFEPNPPTLELLRFNTRGAANVAVHGHGLGDRPGTFDLVEDPANMGGSSMAAQTVPGGSVVRVRVERLDDLDINTSRLCFIKIDVEGFEPAVLRGAERTLREAQPLIVLEQHTREFSNGSTPSIDLLLAHGYRFCWHQAGSAQGSLWGGRMVRLWSLFAGERHQIVAAERVPPGHYSMLIAVPPRFAVALGLG
jgi:FkbM family methyltransferase